MKSTSRHHSSAFYFPWNGFIQSSLSLFQTQIIMSVCMPTVARVDVSSVRLILWDLGGQEDLQSLWDKVCTLAI